MTKFPGWRTMSSAQRHNAKAAAIFDNARKQGHVSLDGNDPSSKALQTARKIAKLNNLTLPDYPQRRDTSFPDKPPCCVVMEHKKYAVVVHHDDPKTIASTGNYVGRFVPL